MPSNRLAFAALAAACIGAAAVGGYFGSRQNSVPVPTQAASNPVSVAAPASGPGSAGSPVQVAEAVNGDRDAASDGKSSSSPAAPSAKPSVESPRRVERPSQVAAPTQTAARASRPSAPAELSAGLDRPSPGGAAVNGASSPNVTAPPAPPAEASPQSRADERVAQEPSRAPELPQPTFEELVVVADSVIGLQAETNVTSDRARVEDRVEARVTRDVRVRDMVAIPAGSRALGTVVSVERGGKFKDRARLGIRFNTLVLADNTRIPISTDTIYREGNAPGQESAAKMTGAAVGGAILGAILGGSKGAAIGGAVGAGAGAAGVMSADRSQATLYSGEPITVRILAPITVTIEQK